MEDEWVKSHRHSWVNQENGEMRKCFVCDGTGQMCGRCGESEGACSCEEEDEEPMLEPCKDCKGTGIASADLPPEQDE